MMLILDYCNTISYNTKRLNMQIHDLWLTCAGVSLIHLCALTSEPGVIEADGAGSAIAARIASTRVVLCIQKYTR